MQEHFEWIELIGELPKSGFIMYGSQKLTFPESPAHGYRRVERLKYGWNAEKATRRIGKGMVRVYDAYNPAVVEDNMKAAITRDSKKWLAFIAIKASERDSKEWNGKEWVDKPVPEVEPVVEAEPVVESNEEPAIEPEVAPEVDPDEITEVSQEDVDIPDLEPTPEPTTDEIDPEKIQYMTVAQTKKALTSIGIEPVGDEIKALKTQLREALKD